MTDIIQTVIFGLALGGVYALMASGLTLIFGVMRIVNLAHPAFIIAAAFLTFWLFTAYGLDPILAVPIAAIVMFCVGIIVYKLTTKRVNYLTNPSRLRSDALAQQFLPTRCWAFL